jgi:hypothetical protein
MSQAPPEPGHYTDGRLWADDLPINIRGMRALVQAFPATPLPPEEVETLGRADTVILPAMAEHLLATCPVAEPSWYDGPSDRGWEPVCTGGGAMASRGGM